jgi:hypothetical protein
MARAAAAWGGAASQAEHSAPVAGLCRPEGRSAGAAGALGAAVARAPAAAPLMRGLAGVADLAVAVAVAEARPVNSPAPLGAAETAGSAVVEAPAASDLLGQAPSAARVVSAARPA